MITVFLNKKIFLLGFFTLLLVCGFGFSSKAEAATNVYYSVGQNVTDHSSGGNVTITSGVANFTTAQTATNLGVGDKLTAGGNTYYLASKITTSSWNVVTALGATPSNLGSTAVTSITHAFSSLSGAITGASGASYVNSSNLVTANVILNIPVYYDSGVDNTAVSITSYTTDTSHYIHIYTPTSTTAEVNQSQRHDGKWNTGKYILAVADADALSVSSDNVYIDGLQIQVTSQTVTRRALYSTYTNTRISNSILKGAGSSQAFYGAYFSSGGGTAYVWNTIVYNVGSSGSSIGVYCANSETCYIYSSTIITPITSGTGIQNTSATVISKNTYASGYPGYAFYGTITKTTDASSDTSGSIGLQNIAVNTTTFTNVTASTEDYHITVSSALKGSGTDTTGDTTPLNFSTDIDGQTRSAPWDVGVDQSQASDSTAPIVDTFTIPATTNSLTISVSSFTAHDNVGVTGYLITESSTAPASGAAGWTGSAPTSYTISGSFSSKTLYAWAKDAAGNVSLSLNATIIFDNTAPTITGFAIPSTATSLTVPITTFTATDANGVTGYMATTTSSAPLANDSTWLGTAPTSYTFSSGGAKTLYGWAKDSAGNVSTSGSGVVTITPTYFVLAGGTGNNSGTDWDNANCKIPATLNPGDVIYIGNSGGNLADTTTGCAGEASHVFNTSGTSGSHITIKAASAADHGTATGWNASYGVDVTPKITWQNSFLPAAGLKAPFWDFCGSYYDVDGKVGTSDTTGSYGFYFKSAGDMYGFVRAESHQCSEASITDLTFQHLELDGVDANSINGFGGATGLDFGSSVSGTATVNNISMQNFYLHDIFAPFSAAGRTTGLTLTNGWIYTNFSNTVAHSQGIQTQAGGGPYSVNNFTVTNTVWRNIQGTGFLMCLGGTCDNWKIYNNIFYYSSNWDSVCEHSDTTATCGVSKIVGDNGPSASPLTNLIFYGNTIANIHLKPGHAGADEAGIVSSNTGSTGLVKNNLWWNNTSANLYYDGSNSRALLLTHDYNTFLNTGYNSTAMVLGSHDFQIGTAPSGIAVNPFINQYSNFNLISESVNAHLNDGISLASPYNVDFAGITRGVDSTWERGAYEVGTTYTIGGTISGLSGTVVLQNNGSDNYSTSTNGSFVFATGLNENENKIKQVGKTGKGVKYEKI